MIYHDGNFNIKNSHDRDNRVDFTSETHTYKIDDIETISVTTLIRKFFKEFDALGSAMNLRPNHILYGKTPEEIVEIWNEKGRNAANGGTFLHEQIERYYLGLSYEKPSEFKHFELFYNHHKTMIPYRSEWRIFDESHNIAGTIDMLVQDGDRFDMYDWKRSERILDNNKFPIVNSQWRKSGIKELSHVPDTSYNHHCLQQSLYKYILENNYGIKVNKMYLVIIHPAYNTYYKVEAVYMEKEVEAMLNSYSISL